MVKIGIVPVAEADGTVSYRAIAGDRLAQGATPGAALDALTGQLSSDVSGTLVIVQSRRPDQYFGAAAQERLAQLMDRWRASRDSGSSLSPGDQSELETLIDMELGASAERAQALLRELRQE